MANLFFLGFRLIVLSALALGYVHSRAAAMADVGDAVSAAWLEEITGRMLIFYGIPTVLCVCAIALRIRFRPIAVLTADALATLACGVVYRDGFFIILVPFLVIDWIYLIAGNTANSK